MNPGYFKGLRNRGKKALPLLIACLISAVLINIVYIVLFLYRDSSYLLLLPIFTIVAAIIALFLYIHFPSFKDNYDNERLHILSAIESALKFAKKGFVLCDRDSTIIRLSGAIHKMTGFYLNEGDKIEAFNRLLGDKDIENLSKAISSVLKGYEVQNLEAELHLDKANNSWLSLDMVPVHVNSFDDYDGFFLTITDITERHILQERRDLIYHLNHVLAIDEGDRSTINNASKVITRLHPGSTAIVFLDEEEKLEIAGAHMAAESYDSALAEETIKAGYTLIRPLPQNKDDNIVFSSPPILNNIISIPLISGTDVPGVLQIVGNFNECLLKRNLPIFELSARMLADYVLRHKNREKLGRLSLIVKHSMEGILLLNKEGIISYANDALLSLLNTTAIDIVGQDYQAVFDISDDDKLLLEQLRKNDHLNGEMKLRCRGGGTAVVLASIFTVQKSTEEPEMFAALLTDITASAAQDAEIRRQQMQIIHADRISMLSSLVASLSDSIRQPLTAISLSASLAMESSQANSPAYRWSKVENIKRQVDQIERTIRNINLLVSNQDPPEEDYNPLEIVKNTIHAYQRLFQADDIKVNLRTGKDLPLVKGQGMRVFQLLSNLLMHSYEAVISIASEDKELSKEIGIACEYAPNIRNLILSVYHKGIDIKPASLINLFDSAAAPSEPGKEELKTGLSLSICEEIATDLGGHLYIENQSDGTIVITVNLPVDIKQQLVH